MKLRNYGTLKTQHAACLALLGWYLMVPLGNHRLLGEDAPLWQWKQRASFDSAAQCESYRNASINLLNAPPVAARYQAKQSKMQQQGRDPIPYQIYLKALDGSLCIAADDPRLMGR